MKRKYTLVTGWASNTKLEAIDMIGCCILFMCIYVYIKYYQDNQM